jgi:hypothetical protein
MEEDMDENMVFVVVSERNGLGAELLEAAARAEVVEHWLYCEGCGRETRHDLAVRGYWEFYTCQVCGGGQSFQVR